MYPRRYMLLHMKLVLLSYSHHGRSIGIAAGGLGHEIVGVMDGESGPRQKLEDEFQCPGYSSAGECLDSCQADAAIVTGRHIDIPGHAAACVDRRMPYIVDKPFADCAARLRPVAELSEKHGVISGLTLPNRMSRIRRTVLEMISNGSFGEPVIYSSRLNNGPPSRYDPTPSAWHNDPSISGGGSWAVEAAHGIDTFLEFAGGREVKVAGAVMSNKMYGRPVEDVAVGVLRTDDGITGIVESGYSYPSGKRSGDHFFRFIGTKASVFEHYGPNAEPLIEVHTTDGVVITEDISNSERMKEVVADCLGNIAAGRNCEPSIAQAVRILEIQDAVYDHARKSLLTSGPHAMGQPPAGP